MANWQERLDAMTFDERVEATVEALHRRPAYARVMRATLEYCREERRSEDVEDYIKTLEDFTANRQSPRRYVFFLMRTGALAELGYDADGNVVDENSVAAVQEELTPKPTDPDSDADIDETEQHVADEAAQEQGAEESEDFAAADTNGSDDEAPCTAEEVSDAATIASDAEGAEDAGAADADAAVEGADADQPAAEAEPEDPQDRIVEWRLIVTDVGLAALEATDHRTLLRDLLSSQARHRFEAYTDLITFCEEPHSLDDIIKFLNENHLPGLEIDSRGIMGIQPNAYISKLENAGALTWDGALKCWKTTREALEVLETL